MKLEKKIMSKENWKRVTKKKYVYIPINEEDKKGEASLLYIQNVTEPCYKNYQNRIVKIAEENYYWLQIALEKENYWITAMYDNTRSLIQYYIDISEKNVISTNGESYFYDLFLDIVLMKDGTLYLLDKKELDNELQNKNISEAQYILACNTANNIIDNVSKYRGKIEKLCNKYFDILVRRIDKVIQER